MRYDLSRRFVFIVVSFCCSTARGCFMSMLLCIVCDGLSALFLSFAIFTHPEWLDCADLGRSQRTRGLPAATSEMWGHQGYQNYGACFGIRYPASSRFGAFV
jgi:hypothetical protein